MVESASALPIQLEAILRRQKYHLVGAHSAVKRCRWLYESLVNDRVCYKQRFYGIESHRCIQMTPTVAFCNMRCLFCWRVQPEDVDISWNELAAAKWDDPTEIVDGCLASQKRLVSGYKSNHKVPIKKLGEAMEPRHVAISLAGEPTLYPRLGELISEFHKRGFTTFLVTNGTSPEALAQLDEEPTQLYVSLCAPDRNAFVRTCRPQISNAWERIDDSLELIPSLGCRTVIRITLVESFNMKDPERYARLIRKAHPDFVEPKASMFVGFSRKRIDFHNMPTHTQVEEFAKELATELGYNLLDESPASRVVLLSRFAEKRPLRVDF